MPFIDENWTDQEKALVWSDEVIQSLVETYNDLVTWSKSNPEIIPVLQKFKFAASHGMTVRDTFIRPAVKKEIWDLVDQAKLRSET